MIFKGRSPTMRHVSRTQRVCSWLAVRQDKFGTKDLDTKNQLADILAKGSLSRDEWNHFLRSFNIFWVSRCFLVAILVIFFLTIRLESRAPCQNEVKKATSNEGSPMAKARPCLVARDQRSEDISSQSLGSLVNPVNTDEREEAEIAAGNSMRSALRSEFGYSQANRQENVPMAAGNSRREDQLQAHSDERLQQNEETRASCVNTRITKHEIHEPSTHEQDLSVSAKEIGNVSKRRNILSASFQNKCIEMVNVHVFVDESRLSSWAELFGEFQKIRGDWKFVQHYSKVGNGTFWRDSECEMSGIFITVLGDISIISGSSDQMSKGKSMCLCWRAPFLPLVVPRWRSPTGWAFCPCWRWRWREMRLPVETQQFSMLLDCWILLCLVLVECWQAHLLMIYNQVVDTVVLLVYWSQRLSCRRCCYIVVVVCGVHYD